MSHPTGLPLAVCSPFLDSISSMWRQCYLRISISEDEATVAAAGLPCFPLPASNQTSVQGQCYCEAGTGLRHPGRGLWERVVPVQVVFYLRCVWDELFLHLWSPHGNRFQMPGKMDNRESEGHFIVFQALLMPNHETVTKYLIFGIMLLQLLKKWLITYSQYSVKGLNLQGYLQSPCLSSLILHAALCKLRSWPQRTHDILTFHVAVIREKDTKTSSF